ncbi:hypothetical protein [uncultured Roseobacter sp.]|uniref:hypothetical protein n=1 Tax=uncultured Roseobacter sp. TaxID=114847 RepID=UPI00260729F6|nr:hypothetical protein [uncultured Roseobacter sp.]
MTETEEILVPIRDLQHFAEKYQHHGLIAGLRLVLEEYINETSSNEEVRQTALCALREAI